MTTYPNAFCVKCGKHTESLQKHTVVMQNGSRAVKGVCADCASAVYKIVPKQAAFQADAAKPAYPDAFCVKCQAHTPTDNARTVMLDNSSRAVTGNCAKCGSEVYRILAPRRDPNRASTLRLVPASKEGATTLKLSPNGMASSQAGVAQAQRAVRAEARASDGRRASEAPRASSIKTAATAIAVIGAIIAGFVAYSLLG